MNKATYDFLKIWAPSFLVFFSYSLTIFMLSWFINQSPSGGGDVLGIVVASSNLVATIIVVAFSGFIDRVRRTKFLTVMQMILFAIILSLTIPYTEAISGLMMIMFVAFVFVTLEGAFSLYSAALETSIADLAPKKWASNRTALLIQLQPQIGRVVAPMLGGVLLATGYLYISSVAASIAVLVSMAFLLIWSQILRDGEKNKEPSTEKMTLRSLFMDAKGAWSWIIERQILVFLLVIGFITSMVIPSFYQLLPAFISEMPLDNQNEEVFYGTFSSAYGVGMLLTSLLFIKLAKHTKKPGVVSTGLVFLMGLVMLLITVVQSSIFLIASNVVLGVLFIMLVMFVGGAWLDMTPSSIRVRVFSLRRLVTFVSIPAGNVIMGLGGAALGYMVILRWLVGFMIVALILSIFMLKGWNQETEVKKAS